MRIAFGKQKPNRLQTHHAVCLWFKFYRIFNCGAIIFLPVPPTLGPPNNIISPLSEHPTPTLLSPLLTPPLLSLLTRAYLLNIAAALPTSHTYYHSEGEETNESQQTKGTAGWAIWCRSDRSGLCNLSCSSWWQKARLACVWTRVCKIWDECLSSILCTFGS